MTTSRFFWGFLAGIFALLPLGIFSSRGMAADRPNIVLIYGDDVGYGDVGCYGATKIKTPNIDRLASQGLRFTDGHAPSATCTPSRYALLTGLYAWRKPGTGILPGDAAMIIEPRRTTLASMLQKAGYTTGVVGKWHLGLGSGKVNWNEEIKPGPREIGFDYSFLIPATGDRVPCVYVENQRVVGLDPADPITVAYGQKVGDEPTGKEHPELLKMKLSHGHDNTIVNGISRIGYMAGGKAARWVDEDMADVITDKAVKFIEKHQDEPFFLFFSAHDIHVPRAPHARYIGTSECGVRGDMMQQFDGSVGQIMAALERLKLAEDTIVIFTSDNGPVVDDGYADGSVKNLNGHTPAGPLNGGKYSNFEGGTRVPFIVRWPARIKPGTSDALVCQIDFLASFAKLAQQSLENGEAPDSENVLPALLGESQQGRKTLVEHANRLSLRQGHWKYISPQPLNNAKGKKAGGKAAQVGELYNLSTDLGEKQNVAAEHPQIVAEMEANLAKIRDQRQ
jgi:arylsulfatase A-like enzyme